jgi:hypothetical protein
LAEQEKDKEAKAKIILKATQIEDNIRFNDKFLAFLDTQ